MSQQQERSRSAGSRPSLLHRYSSPNPNSSAFSASANPNEDWTKIADLAERRRLQNRIAQRNYRKKLKKRLEDLEQRASASPEPEPHRPFGRLGSSVHSSLGPAPTSTARYVPDEYESERHGDSPERSYPFIPDSNSTLPPPDDRHLSSRSQPTFSYTSFGRTDNLSSPFPHSPALSSYSIPSPSLSATSYHYDDYFTPTHEASLSPSCGTTTIEDDYFGQDYSTYAQGFDTFEQPRKHLSVPQHSSYGGTSYHEYSKTMAGALDLFDRAINGPPSKHDWPLFTGVPLESPHFFELQ